MTKILISGANGQLGSEIKEISGEYPNFKFLFHDIDTLDFTNFKKVKQYIEEELPKYIINCAAYNAVDKAEQETDKAFLINTEIPAELSKISQKNNIRFFHISTDFVFDGKINKPYKETTKPKPLSVYAQSKYSGEMKVLENKNSIIIRTSWLYSIFGNNFMKTMLELAKVKKSLNVVYDQIGTPTYARDLAIAILNIISGIEGNRKKYVPGIYHYSNEGVASWYDFAFEIVHLLNLDCCVNPIPTKDFPLPAKRPHYSVLDKGKIKKTYNLLIPHWKESLIMALEEFTMKE